MRSSSPRQKGRVEQAHSPLHFFPLSSRQETGMSCPSAARRIWPAVISSGGREVASAFAHGAFRQGVFAEDVHDAFEIFPGDILPVGDVIETDKAARRAICQIEHHSQGIAPLGRDHHRENGSFLAGGYSHQFGGNYKR